MKILFGVLLLVVFGCFVVNCESEGDLRGLEFANLALKDRIELQKEQIDYLIEENARLESALKSSIKP